jgi:diacylglycerol kinase family enzyme
MRLVKTQVIVNPASNRGRTRKRWGEIRDALRGFFKEFRYEFTEKPCHATELTREAIRSGTELVIGVGGDGTMNEIANGFYEGPDIINPESTLGIVPSGTGCDLTKSLNIPPGLHNALRVITEAPSSPIDVGQVTFRSPQGGTERRFFLNVADFASAARLSRRSTSAGSSGEHPAVAACRDHAQHRANGCVWSTAASFLRTYSSRCRQRPDLGKGMKVAPQARLDDGLFDLVLVKGMRFLEFCRYGWRLINGSHLHIKKVAFVRGRTVEAEPVEDEPVLLELDGEQLGTLPAKFEVVPKSLLVKGFLQKA